MGLPPNGRGPGCRSPGPGAVVVSATRLLQKPSSLAGGLAIWSASRQPDTSLCGEIGHRCAEGHPGACAYCHALTSSCQRCDTRRRVPQEEGGSMRKLLLVLLTLAPLGF